MMDEEILAPIIGCDESVTLLVTEPLHGATSQDFPPRDGVSAANPTVSNPSPQFDLRQRTWIGEKTGEAWKHPGEADRTAEATGPLRSLEGIPLKFNALGGDLRKAPQHAPRIAGFDASRDPQYTTARPSESRPRPEDSRSRSTGGHHQQDRKALAAEPPSSRERGRSGPATDASEPA
jgi:hypothetical protein